MRVYNCFPEGKSKILTMSYDDGKIEDIRLIDIFNKYGIKGTFNLNSGLYEGSEDGRPLKAEVKDIYEGHEVATHTYTHPMLANCPVEEVVAEIVKDREELERLTGTIIRGHAYPYSSYNADIKLLLKQLGIAYGRVVPPKEDYELPSDPMEWHPTCHHNDPSLMKKAQDFVKYPYSKLMYVWGHSYEFTKNDNWDVIEEFCSFVGGRDEIWYATNIEIIDYMDVQKNLKFSANGRCVYNPSAKSAWLRVDDKYIVEVPGGQFVDLEKAVN